MHFKMQHCMQEVWHWLAQRGTKPHGDFKPAESPICVKSAKLRFGNGDLFWIDRDDGCRLYRLSRVSHSINSQRVKIYAKYAVFIESQFYTSGILRLCVGGNFQNPGFAPKILNDHFKVIPVYNVHDCVLIFNTIYTDLGYYIILDTSFVVQVDDVFYNVHFGTINEFSGECKTSEYHGEFWDNISHALLQCGIYNIPKSS